MARFLSACCDDHRVFVIEQSDDQRKFNRGQLLNVGAILAERDQCDSLIFHDVDLLPSDDLRRGLRRFAIGRQAPAHRAGLGPLQWQQGLFRGRVCLDDE